MASASTNRMISPVHRKSLRKASPAIRKKKTAPTFKAAADNVNAELTFMAGSKASKRYDKMPSSTADPPTSQAPDLADDKGFQTTRAAGKERKRKKAPLNAAVQWSHTKRSVPGGANA